MTYSVGGNIQAADYNGFTGGAAANVSGQINPVITTGRGNAGYGQTSVANVSATANVLASSWTTLINAVNTARKHQSGAGYSNLSTVTSGANIAVNGSLSGTITTAYTSRLTAAAAGSTVNGTTQSPVWSLSSTTAASTYQFTRTATFANGDAARYFFNAGGSITFSFQTPTNNDGTRRSQSMVNLMSLNFSSKQMNAITFGAKSASGNATTNTDRTDLGYYGQTTANTIITQLTSTQTTYTGDQLYFLVRTNGAQGSNADNGTIIYFSCNLVSGAQTGGFNDSINITVNHRLQVVYPSTSFLANTWGTVTLA